jgi:hypothetical protein
MAHWLLTTSIVTAGSVGHRRCFERSRGILFSYRAISVSKIFFENLFSKMKRVERKNASNNTRNKNAHAIKIVTSLRSVDIKVG